MKKPFLVRFYQVIFFSIHLLLALALLALPACRNDDAGSTPTSRKMSRMGAFGG